MARPPRRRAGDAGVTLVEMLVVLVLIGVLAGAAALGIGTATRGPTLAHEADLLAARLNRAADEVLLSGHAMRFEPGEARYRFRVWQDGAWVAHPVAVLAATHVLPAGMTFPNTSDAVPGSFTVSGDMLPSTGAPVTIAIAAGRGDATRVVFDGLNARVAVGAR